MAVQPYIEWMNLNFLKKERILDKIEWEYVKTNKVWTQFSTEVCNTLIFEWHSIQLSRYLIIVLSNFYMLIQNLQILPVH